MRAANLVSRDAGFPQPGFFSLREFAKKFCIPRVTMFRRLRDCRVLGAFQDIASRVWSIPPAAVLAKPRKPRKPRRCKSRAGKSVAMQSRGFDVGTSPHGLSADLRMANQKTRKASALPLSAKPLLTLVSPGEPPVNSWLALLPKGKL